MLVIEGRPSLHIPFDVVFDAQEYDDIITFGAEIIATTILGDTDRDALLRMRTLSCDHGQGG